MKRNDSVPETLFSNFSHFDNLYINKVCALFNRQFPSSIMSFILFQNFITSKGPHLIGKLFFYWVHYCQVKDFTNCTEKKNNRRSIWNIYVYLWLMISFDKATNHRVVSRAWRRWHFLQAHAPQGCQKYQTKQNSKRHYRTSSLEWNKRYNRKNLSKKPWNTLPNKSKIWLNRLNRLNSSGDIVL